MSNKEPAGDEHLGRFVYCTQHHQVHSTGWCTVHARDKIALQATTHEDAFAEWQRIVDFVKKYC